MHAGCFIVWWAVQRYEYVRVRTLSVPARPTVIRLITGCTPQHHLASRWLPAGHRGLSRCPSVPGPPWATSRAYPWLRLGLPRAPVPSYPVAPVPGSPLPPSRATPSPHSRAPPCSPVRGYPVPPVRSSHAPPVRGSRAPRLELRRAPASRAHPWLRSGLPRAPVPSSPVAPRPGLPRCRGLPRPFSLLLLRT